MCSLLSIPGTNVLLDSDDNIKLADFGASKQLSVSAYSSSSALLIRAL